VIQTGEGRIEGVEVAADGGRRIDVERSAVRRGQVRDPDLLGEEFSVAHLEMVHMNGSLEDVVCYLGQEEKSSENTGPSSGN